ncbi:MAG TPA: peptidylprolyl isomerase [Abditibacteriaceae bacterium]
MKFHIVKKEHNTMEEKQSRHIVRKPAMRSRSTWHRSMMLPAGVGLAIFAGALSGCNRGGTSTGGTNTGGDTIATVNGTAVGRNELHSLLEATGGEAAVRELVLRQLVMQELQKQGLTVTDEEVQNGLKELAARQGGPNPEELQRAISTPGPRQEYYRNFVRTDIALNRLITKDVKVDEAQLKTWFEKNKSRYGTPAQVKLGMLLTSTKVRADTMAAQLKGGTKTFTQLVQEQKKAQDQVAQQSMAEMPEFMAMESLSQFSPAVAAQIKNLKPNQNTGAMLLTPGVGQKIYGIVRLAARQEAKQPDFASMRETAEQDYKLEQVAKKDLPPGATMDQMLKQVEGMIVQENAQRNPGAAMQRPSYRDLLNFMVQGSRQRVMTNLQQGAKVEIADASYARVAEFFKPQPAAGAPGAPGAGAPGGAPGGAPQGVAPQGAAPQGGAPAAPPAGGAAPQ